MAIKRSVENAYGLNSPLTSVFPEPIVSQRSPTAADSAPIGTLWVDKPNDDAYILTSVVANSATWIGVGRGAAAFTNITVSESYTQSAGTFDVDGSALTLDGTSASNFSVAGVGIDLTLDSAAGRVIVAGGEATANAVTISATDAAGGVDINSGTGGISIDSTGTGDIALVPGTNSVAGFFLTLNAKIGAGTFTGLTIFTGAEGEFTITNSEVSATSAIIVTITNGGTNEAWMTLVRVKQAAGSFQVLATNRGPADLNGDVVISWMVLN